MENSIDSFANLPRVCDVEEFYDTDNIDVAKADSARQANAKKNYSIASSSTASDTLVIDILSLLDWTDKPNRYSFDMLNKMSYDRLIKIHAQLEDEVYG